MSKLTEFLIGNPVDDLQDEVFISDRFKVPAIDDEGNTKLDKDGNVIHEILKFKIKAMKLEEFSELQKKYTKTKKKEIQFNAKGFNTEVVLNYTLDPNFRNAEDVSKAGCTTPAEYLSKVLLAGEITTLVEKISALSGFDNDVDDIRDEAKN